MRKQRRNMTKVVDMDKIVEGDNSTLEGTGVVKSDRPTTVDAKELPEGTMMEITQPGTNKKFTYPQALEQSGFTAGDFARA